MPLICAVCWYVADLLGGRVTWACFGILVIWCISTNAACQLALEPLILYIVSISDMVWIIATSLVTDYSCLSVVVVLRLAAG